jgi:hypothetical protein
VKNPGTVADVIRFAASQPQCANACQNSLYFGANERNEIIKHLTGSPNGASFDRLASA